MSRQERIDRTERGSLETHLNRAREHATALRGRTTGALRDEYSAVGGLIEYALQRLTDVR